MKYKTLFRLAIKAIGVLVVLEALPLFVSAGVQLVTAVLSPALAAPFGGLNIWLIGHAVGYGLQAALGVYLFYGGAWIVDRAIPSNRTYCHECAYELKGLPAEGVCPECGTAYRLPVAKMRSDASESGP